MKAHVSLCTKCNEEFCPSADRNHLLIESATIELQNVNARAVSYIWGIWHREKRCIGHFSNGELVTMELGVDWDLDGFISSLHQLCHDLDSSGNDYTRPLWIDQLSIKQSSEEEIRETIANIPDIYRTLEVVMLMPGGHCCCQSYITSFLDEHAETNIAESDNLFDHVQSRMVAADYCANNLSFVTYFQRIWTRQEMLYASRLRIHWISDIIACSRMTDVGFRLREPGDLLPSPEQVEAMSLPARLYRRQLLDELSHEASDRDHSIVIRKLEQIAGYGMEAMRQTFFRWFSIHSPAISDVPGQWQREMYRFLSGKLFQATNTLDSLSTREKVLIFSASLFNFRCNERHATKPEDYVIAIWVDCPGYSPPQGYKKKNPAALLQDAVEQMEDNHALSLHTTIPAGLFHAHSGSALFRPSMYLDVQDFHRSQNIYAGACLDACVLPIVSSNRLRLLRNSQRDQSFAKNIRHFEEFAENTRRDEVLDRVTKIASIWHTNVQKTIRDHASSLTFYSPDAFELAFIDFANVSISKTMAVTSERNHREIFKAEPNDVHQSYYKRNLPSEINDWPSAKGVDHCKLVYRLVCCAIGLRMDTAIHNGLQLVIEAGSGDIPSRLGLLRQGFDPKTVTYTVHTGHDPIYTPEGRPSEFCTGMAYEVVDRGKEDGISTYEVVGIFVPHYTTTPAYVDGFVHSQGTAGYII